MSRLKFIGLHNMMSMWLPNLKQKGPRCHFSLIFWVTIWGYNIQYSVNFWPPNFDSFMEPILTVDMLDFARIYRHIRPHYTKVCSHSTQYKRALLALILYSECSWCPFEIFAKVYLKAVSRDLSGIFDFWVAFFPANYNN